LVLALRYPDLFGTFGDYGGLAGPRSGDGNAVGTTVSALFGGSTRAFRQHEPEYLLTHHHFPGLDGWFEAGSGDAGPLAAQQHLVPLAARAGIDVHAVVAPGQYHTFILWSTAFAQSLPWLVAHIG
jgi:S-formylglutathione hydrolase FrmB